MRMCKWLCCLLFCLVLGISGCGGGGGGSSGGGTSTGTDSGATGGTGGTTPTTQLGVLRILNMGQAAANNVTVSGPNGFSASIGTIDSTKAHDLQNAPAGNYTVTYTYMGSDMYGRPTAPVAMQKTGSVLATTLRGSIGLTTGLPPTVN